MQSKLKRAGRLLNQKNPDAKAALRLLEPLAGQRSAPWQVFHFMGLALIRKGELEKAAGNLQKAFELKADSPQVCLSLSTCYYHLQQFEEAEKYARKTVEIKDDYFKAWMQLGAACKAQANLNEALGCYRKANQIDPKSAEVALKIAVVYKDQGMQEKALEMFDIVLKMDPGNKNAFIEKSRIYQSRNQLDRAEQCLNKVIESDTEDPTAHMGLAELYKKRGDYEEATALYENLLETYPGQGEIRSNYASCLKDLGMFDESEKNYKRASEDSPGLMEPLSNYLMSLHYNPQRTREEIFEAHKLWDRQFAPVIPAGRPVPFNRDRDKKLRIGLISGGFRRHPVGWMITGGLEHLPGEHFDLCFYTTNNKIDPITRRLHRRSDVWRPVTGYRDEVIAQMIREDEIDILVDLSGHSAENRLRTISLEPAPVIVKWVGGLFNTTGLKSVDFLIADRHEVPPGEEAFYTEKLVRMPDDYICFLPPDYAPDVQPLPAGETGRITFGCFNNPAKVNPVILEKWAGILNRVPGSRLFLKSKQYGTDALRKRITEKMAEYEIPESRLMFEGQSPHDELLGSYSRVDIALDPWPYSGGLTTCEALWMGVPVITRPGPTFAGRHSATHLVNAGFPDGVTVSWEKYVDKAVSLAEDRAGLAALRSGLRGRVARSPLCDGDRFGTCLANAFRQMWCQRVDGYEHGLEEWQNQIDVDPAGESGGL